MRSIFVLGLVLCAIAVAIAQKDDAKKGDAKLFFTTLTVYVSTTKSTSTLTSTTTCTTSTTTLTTCTAGRRRRGLFYQDGNDSRARRGLFFNDDEEEKGSIFLASVDEKKSADPVDEVKPSKTEVVTVPVEVQAGFSLPKQVDNTRFLLAFATSTSTVFTVSIATSKLTAVCSSTTGFSSCT